MKMGSRRVARIGMIIAAALVAACARGGNAHTPAAREEARHDSAQLVQKALQDSGVSVDTQSIDTGGVRATPAADD
jgi:hypothetical protein